MKSAAVAAEIRRLNWTFFFVGMGMGLLAYIAFQTYVLIDEIHGKTVVLTDVKKES